MLVQSQMSELPTPLGVQKGIVPAETPDVAQTSKDKHDRWDLRANAYIAHLDGSWEGVRIVPEDGFTEAEVLYRAFALDSEKARGEAKVVTYEDAIALYPPAHMATPTEEGKSPAETRFRLSFLEFEEESRLRKSIKTHTPLNRFINTQFVKNHPLDPKMYRGDRRWQTVQGPLLFTKVKRCRQSQKLGAPLHRRIVEMNDHDLVWLKGLTKNFNATGVLKEEWKRREDQGSCLLL